MAGSLKAKFSCVNRVQAFLLGSVLVNSISKGLVLPFFAIFLSKNLGLPSVEAGLILGINLGLQSFGSLPGGWLSDRWGIRQTAILGLCLTGLGYLGLAFPINTASLACASALLGMGPAMFAPAVKKQLAQSSSPKDLVFVFSLRRLSFNLGAALGPIIGSLVFFSSPRILFVACCLTQALLASILVFFLGSDRIRGSETTAGQPSWRHLLSPRMAVVMILSIGFFMFYVQIDTTMPLMTIDRFGTSGILALNIANSLAVIGLQIPLSPVVSRIKPRYMVCTGFMLFCFSFLLVTVRMLPVFLLGVIIFTIAEIVVSLFLDLEISRNVHIDAQGLGFGLVGAGMALGSIIGSVIGSHWFASAGTGPPLTSFWCFLAGAAMLAGLVTLALHWLWRGHRVKKYAP